MRLIKQSKKLLIVAHTPSTNTQALAKAMLTGAQDKCLVNTEAALRSPFECNAVDVLSSDAIILFTTENFGSMCGAIKDFFERIYYPCLEQPQQNEAKPYALVIRAGMDGTGTDINVHKITTGLNWKEVQPTLICKGEYHAEFEQQASELALTVAASLDNELL